ncbi:Hypothetical predicted protein [Cloeon dipterum]|uniref:DNA/RNA non-specific endonuclease domain-containing protein n=1 Tax=Cloeon dipterum TaxID=197152 RepID=A0A8S1C3G2_9INSE|nr:Hypothetical predicted protein [Cloeon dipterum]
MRLTAVLLVLVLGCGVIARDAGVRKPINANAKPFGNNYSSGQACAINLKKDFPRNQPLVLSTSGRLVMPDTKGTLQLQPGQVIILSCPGKENKLAKLGTKESAVSCGSGSELNVSPDKRLPMKELDCTSLIQHSARKNEGEKCEVPGNYQVIDIGFDLPNGTLIPVLKTCFDPKNEDAIYAKFTMTPSIGGAQSGEQRPQFVEGPFYPNLNVNSKYVKEGQRATLAHILGSEELANKYIGEGDYYLARGHLAARADFVYSSHQRATFWYVNVAPQWQTFNGGNWNTLEDNVRKFASRSGGHELVVYTGTHGIATLPDAQGKEQPLYLSVDGSAAKLKVPAIFWKVVLEPSTGKGVAFVGVNNPYKEELETVCEDICDQIDWLTWQPKKQKLGFGYCCAVTDLSRAVPNVPKLKITGLLV